MLEKQQTKTPFLYYYTGKLVDDILNILFVFDVLKQKILPVA